jgi:hypothetical protein
MALQFNVVNPEGVEGQVGVNDIVQQLQGSGEQILGVSADGSTIKMQDATGEFEAKTEDVLKDLGWQIQRAAPINPNYSAVNSDWRQAITMLPADDHKRAYLEGQFKKAGMGNVNIVGTGRDWYAFDPESNQYLALTNNPEWDSSDVREGLVTAPRVAGSVIGGAAGAVMGGGANPLTGAVGAGLGGGAADALTRAYGASRDPLLKEIMTGDMGAMAKDVGINAGLDALTQGAFLGIPKVAGALAPELGQGGFPLPQKRLVDSPRKGAELLIKQLLLSIVQLGGKLRPHLFPLLAKLLLAVWRYSSLGKRLGALLGELVLWASRKLCKKSPQGSHKKCSKAPGSSSDQGNG